MMLKALSRTAICATLLLPIEAQALQHTYVSGNVWAVTQSAPWGAVTESGLKPTCNLSTQIWDESGFVSGVFDKDTRAAWTVDGGATASSRGSLSDYFDWYMFDELPVSILDELVSGQELRIVEFGGKGTTVSLVGARYPIISFSASPSVEPVVGSTSP